MKLGSLRKSCENCKYIEEGRCYRHPPTAIMYGVSMHPTVNKDNWCGEWSYNEELNEE